MAINRWKKYVIGMSGVALIGGAVGIAQKIDSFNNPVATNTTTDTTGSVQSNTQDPIQQEFVVTDPNAQSGDIVVEPAPSSTSTPTARPTSRPVVRPTPNSNVAPKVEYEEYDEDDYAWEEREHEDEGEHHRREHGEYERQSYSTQQSNSSSTRIRSQAS